MLTITKIFEFSSSHYLCNRELQDSESALLFGHCSKVHGHNYKLEVTVSGPLSKSERMIMNTAHLKELVKENVINDLDHNCLNDVGWLQSDLPTVENLITSIWQRLEKALSSARPEVKLRRLRLWETNSIYAELEK